MTLRIALIGAPTSGKTELADKLQTSLLPRSLQIIDDYVEPLSKRTNQAFSHYANYIGNSQIALERFACELEAEHGKNNDGGLGVRITCGTVVETTVYTALFSLYMAQSENRNFVDKRSQTHMNWLGVLSHDTWDYDCAFVLPLADDAEAWSQVVEEHIPEAVESLGLKVTYLPQDKDEQLANALEEILAVEEANGSGVRQGGSPGEDDSDSVGDMPDVRSEAP